MLAGGQYPVSAGNHLKRHSPGGATPPGTYRSPAETEFYYLNSRYYSPKISRFINADTYVATGQGIVGNNMFAYCLNNPVMCTDEDGDICDKRIHDEVLRHICEKNSNLSNDKTCIYYNGKNIWGGYGFCDLYNKETGEVWELKKVSNSRSCQTEKARKQLDRYIHGRLKWDKSRPLKLPDKTVIEGDSFNLEDAFHRYWVQYYYEGNGILRYTYTVTDKEPPKFNSSDVVAGAMVGITVIGLLLIRTGLLI